MSGFEYPEGIPSSEEVNLHTAKGIDDALDAVASYEEPDGELWFGERYEEDKKIIAYTDFASIAFVDVVQVQLIGSKEVLGPLLMHVDGEVQEVGKMLHHPSLYASPDKAREVFEKAA